MLDERGLIPEKYETNKQVKAKKDTDHKYNFQREGQSHPKKVHVLETGTVDLYPCIYKAALAFDQNPGVIAMYNGKVCSKKYAIKVLTDSKLILICS